MTTLDPTGAAPDVPPTPTFRSPWGEPQTMDALLDALVAQDNARECRLAAVEVERDAALARAHDSGMSAAKLRQERDDLLSARVRGIEGHKAVVASMKKRTEELEARIDELEADKSILESKVAALRPKFTLGALTLQGTPPGGSFQRFTIPNTTHQ